MVDVVPVNRGRTISAKCVLRGSPGLADAGSYSIPVAALEPVYALTDICESLCRAGSHWRPLVPVPSLGLGPRVTPIASPAS